MKAVSRGFVQDKQAWMLSWKNAKQNVSEIEITQQEVGQFLIRTGRWKTCILGAELEGLHRLSSEPKATDEKIK